MHIQKGGFAHTKRGVLSLAEAPTTQQLTAGVAPRGVAHIHFFAVTCVADSVSVVARGAASTQHSGAPSSHSLHSLHSLLTLSLLSSLCRSLLIHSGAPSWRALAHPTGVYVSVCLRVCVSACLCVCVAGGAADGGGEHALETAGSAVYLVCLFVCHALETAGSAPSLHLSCSRGEELYVRQPSSPNPRSQCVRARWGGCTRMDVSGH
jgi:hypothetical protein